MNDKKFELICHNIGLLLRYTVGAVAFGYWQHNWVAGLFMFALLATLETK